MNRVFAILLLFVSVSAMGQKWKPVHAEFDSLANLCERTRNHLQLPAEYNGWLRRMHELARGRVRKGDTANGANPMEWRTLFFEAWFAGRVNDYQTESRLLDEALALVDSVNYEYDYRRLLWNRRLVGNWNHLVDSYRWTRQNLNYFQQIDDKLMIGVLHLNMGRIFDQLHMYEKAEECLERATENYRQIGYSGAIELGLPDRINLMYEMGRLDEARRLYKKALQSKYIMEDTVAYFTLLTSGYYTQIYPEGARQAYNLAREYGRIPSMVLISQVNVGATLIEQGKLREAIDFLRGALAQSVAGDIQETDIKLAAYGNLENAYAALGRTDSAYWFSRERSMLRDSIDALNSNDEFMADIESQLIQQEEAKFAIERDKARIRLIVLCLIAAALVLGAVAFAWWHRMRHRLKEAENERLTAEVEKEHLESQLYQRQCEDRERELTTNSLLLIEKKKMIETLNQQIEECGAEGTIDFSAKRKLLGFIKIHENTEESLQQFYDYFNQVHPDFFHSLKESYPALTQGELRLCAYIRMGLDNKQMAQIMSIQSEGIKKARYRMRKKLGLTTPESLEDFLLLWPGK